MKNTGYELSRDWFDWCYDNPEKINTHHTALYFYCIEQCNRLGWKDKFGLPTNVTKEAIGIHSYNTYIKTLNELIDFGFIELIQKAKNQNTSNIIALSKNYKASNKALDIAIDKATVKQLIKQGECELQSTCTIYKLNKEIYKLLTDNIKTINNKQKEFFEYVDLFFNKKQKLVFPYNSEKFMFLWNELVKMPKWRKKPFSALQLTLHKLSEFEEDFAIELIENAITGNYQGIIFSNTKEKYEQFKQQKYGGENIGNNVKKQGVSKQELANILYEHFQNRDNSGE